MAAHPGEDGKAFAQYVAALEAAAAVQSLQEDGSSYTVDTAQPGRIHL